jgi:membrane protein DedA with SNARE-associated domain
MQALLEHFITQSVMYSLIAVALVAFLESLALVGLILPGTVMMAGLGALIGSGEVNFWQAWLAGIIGCLLGDWISFWLGWRFKKPLHRWSFMKKNKALLDKTEHALHQHSMFTILVGRFVGHASAGADGGRDAGSARREICGAEHYRLRLLAAVLLPAGDPGRCGHRYS